jgi:vacuolar iron transporter family protein
MTRGRTMERLDREDASSSPIGRADEVGRDVPRGLDCAMRDRGVRDPRLRELEGMAARHTPEAIREALDTPLRPSNLRDFIYGAVDGTVTTFAIVAGVAGAQLSAGFVVVLGLANLLADGLSMAVSNFSATRAELQEQDVARSREEHEIRVDPEGEREEVRQIFALKGFEDPDLERVVDVITANREVWIQTMLAEEYGYGREARQPLRAAVITFLSFVAIGLLPLVTFIVEVIAPGVVPSPFLTAAVLAGVAFFGSGAMKSLFVEQPWWRAGLETLLMGGAAATIAYGIGRSLEGLVN